MRLVLASASPRRKNILQTAGIPFVTRPADVDERLLDGESPEEHVQRLAEAKARAVWREGETVLGADTVVVVDSQILGKPADQSEAKQMLRALSGRSHRVLTGMCFFDGASAHASVEETIVYFRDLDDNELADYVATGEAADKAGAYGIQGAASKFIHRIEGCYFNVVGLPVSRVYSFIRSSLR
ncbi:MAG: Maf family protein [Acidobacteria bacterium]|nr:Maf family protein [Acidobacteriota bacterium]